jgi:hypothetical protein
MIGSILTPWRLVWYPRLLLGALAAALLFTLCTGQGAQIVTGRLGGDFPEFYGAGRIVASGNLSALYDEKTQRAAQRDLVPSRASGADVGFVPFAYPPQLALAYSLLARVPYRAAFALQTAFSVACLLAAATLVCRLSPPASRFVPALMAAMVFYYPVFRALLGGQTTPLTLLLVAVAAAASRQGRDWLAGVALGLMLYKPQFGLTLLCVWACGGRWRTVFWGLGVGCAVFLVNTAFFGPDWPGRWFAYAQWVIATSLPLEGEKAISFIGVLQSLARRTQLDLAWIGHGLALATAGVLALAWLRCARTGALTRDQGLFLPLVGLAAAGTILAAPHAYYYDAGLLFLAFPALAQSGIRHKGRLLLALWAAGFTQLLAGLLGQSPLVLLALTVFGCMLLLLRSALADAARETAAGAGRA